MININFPNACTVTIEMLHNFHDWVMIFLVGISWGTLRYILNNNNLTDRTLTESQTVETVWTVIPGLVLLGIGIPSLRLLYFTDDGVGRRMTVKTLGHQWYWSYSYPDHPVYDSYLTRSEYRLLDSDHHLIIPCNIVQVLISAADVLHSWSVPTLGVKGDAVPGRVNKVILLPKCPGVFFGQCREICGSNHRFIPIALESFLFN